MTTTAERLALEIHPELECLHDLRAAGWLFLPLVTHGDLTELRGVRVWHPGWMDLLRLRGEDDLAAVRRDPAGTQVWRRDGSLTEVVDAILALPAPPPWSP